MRLARLNAAIGRGIKKGGGEYMDVQAYCDNITIELTGWRTKLNDIVERLDKLPSGDKEKVVSEVYDLHMLIEEFNDRIERLTYECPMQWEPEKMEMEGKLSQTKKIWEEAADLSVSEPL